MSKTIENYVLFESLNMAEQSMILFGAALSACKNTLTTARLFMQDYIGKAVLADVKGEERSEREEASFSSVCYLNNLQESVERTEREILWYIYKNVPELHYHGMDFYIVSDEFSFRVLINEEFRMFVIRRI